MLSLSMLTNTIHFSYLLRYKDLIVNFAIVWIPLQVYSQHLVLDKITWKYICLNTTIDMLLPLKQKYNFNPTQKIFTLVWFVWKVFGDCQKIMCIFCLWIIICFFENCINLCHLLHQICINQYFKERVFMISSFRWSSQLYQTIILI